MSSRYLLSKPSDWVNRADVEVEHTSRRVTDAGYQKIYPRPGGIQAGRLPGNFSSLPPQRGKSRRSGRRAALDADRNFCGRRVICSSCAGIRRS
ncbi:hypothetical protein EVAR_7381_1 [Eumeta japonica]|uniref:Uncharacterized protein n=1 Tax=Eumeta variegata TaxID=151549 RepID=A0A4C1V725_EUMVA|nr:hypothetical protein EVAR_7381_1 [Eumeta japonica]